MIENSLEPNYFIYCVVFLRLFIELISHLNWWKLNNRTWILPIFWGAQYSYFDHYEIE